MAADSVVDLVLAGKGEMSSWMIQCFAVMVSIVAILSWLCEPLSALSMIG